MNTRLALNLGLLGLVIILGLIAAYEPGRDSPPTVTTLLSIPAEAIEHIRIERRGKENLRLAKLGGEWQLLEPFTAPADDYRINTLLRLAQARSLKQFPLAGQDPTLFGLLEPALTLSLNDQVIHFGDQSALNNRRYVRLGERIHLLEDTVYYHLIGPAAGFASKALLPAGATIIELELPGGEHLVWKESSWKNLAREASIDPDRVNALVDHWRYAQAMAVSPLDTTPQLGEIVRVALKDGASPITFIIRQREPELVLQREDLGLAYHFNAEAAQNLLSLKPVEGATP